MTIPKQAKVVVVGGGVIGAGIAYHLAQLGIGDIVLLERKTLTCGTTWHAAGLVGQLRASRDAAWLVQYSTELYKRLEEETGLATGLRQTGTLNIADSDALMTEYLRHASVGKRLGLPTEILTADDIKQRYPVLTTDDLVGGVFLPFAGQADPTGVTQVLAKAAKQHGAQIFENTPVIRLLTENGHIAGVETPDGEIAADAVVLATGMWSRQLAAEIGVTVPLHACEHYYLVTEPIAEIPQGLPTIRDLGSRAYYKEDAGKILLGCFEEHARPWGEDGIPEDFAFDSLPGDFAHFEPIFEKAMRRLPLLETAGVQLFFCGPESFTPDDRLLLGEAPAMRRLYVAAGLNSVGIQTAGGIGKVLAEWIRDDQAPMSVADVDLLRVMPFQGNRRYLKTRVAESLGVLYSIHWPYRQMQTARNVRLSPLHQTLAAAGACFGENVGWERPNWFAPSPEEAHYEYAYGRQNWFPHCAAECRAASERAVLIDLSSFAKFLVRGADSVRFLNRICANQVDVPVGRIVYTPWLNARGGIEADLTVTRIAADEYLVLSGVASQTRDMAWLNRHRRSDERVEVIDMTSAYANIGVLGPRAADILCAAGAAGVDEDAFPYGVMRQVEVGYGIVSALRLGYIGEAGFELIVPTEFALGVYQALADAGREFGAQNAGLHAVDSMRMEKARRHYGDDLTNEDTPLQAGLGFALCWDKEEPFNGQAALADKRGKPSPKRLLQFSLAAGAGAPLMFGEEPVWRDGELVGGVTSAAYGHRVGLSLALAYVDNADGVTNDWCEAGRWEIEIAGERHAAEWWRKPPYDPENRVLKLSA